MNPQTRVLHSGGLAVAGMAILINGQAFGTPPVMRDAATHQRLVGQRSAAGHDPMSDFEPCEGQDPSRVNPPKDILEKSEILCFGGVATLVPKYALLGIPAKFKARTKIANGARVLPWVEFLAKNRSWISTVEVTADEAAGRQMLPAKTQQAVVDCGNVVVATHLDGPISVLEYRPGLAAGSARK
ncbi:MAG: hypothetical protein K9N23_15865 [Akkermansiaceae bacterium]|nr:hypothetical protein [Akkermansiaceae bacterium]MCF7733167.1 hypothetical protein [Akkermansiaceae bacterium]